MTNDPRRAQARRLRAESRMSLAQLREHFGVSRDTMATWLRGLPTPAWTLRPTAKDDVRERALRLRAEGYPVPAIAAELGVARSTAYLWTRHLPLDATTGHRVERRREHMAHMRESRWGPHRRARDESRATVNAEAAAWVETLSDRELLLIGAVNYWCEGQKAKPWAPNRCRIMFVNSDPVLVLLLVRFLERLGEDRRGWRYRLSIHEFADVDAATRWWADVVAVPPDVFSRPTLKKHNPSTVRHNVGSTYRGCLIIDVPRSRELYWRVEGLVRGIAGAVGRAGDATM